MFYIKNKVKLPNVLIIGLIVINILTIGYFNAIVDNYEKALLVNNIAEREMRLRNLNLFIKQVNSEMAISMENACNFKGIKHLANSSPGIYKVFGNHNFHLFDSVFGTLVLDLDKNLSLMSKEEIEDISKELADIYEEFVTGYQISMQGAGRYGVERIKIISELDIKEITLLAQRLMVIREKVQKIN